LNPKSCIDSSARKEEDLNDIQESPTGHTKNDEMVTITPHVIPKIGRKHKSKRENEDVINLDDQGRKKPKKHGNNIGNIIQNWIEQQEIRQVELDKRREEKEKKEQEQRSELFQMKQQSDMMLFGVLNNLTNCLNSLHEKQNQKETNQGIYFCKLICVCRLRASHIHARTRASRV
jgi:hypothetical protein